jgi:hypothetical protein
MTKCVESVSLSSIPPPNVELPACAFHLMPRCGASTYLRSVLDATPSCLWRAPDASVKFADFVDEDDAATEQRRNALTSVAALRIRTDGSQRTVGTLLIRRQEAAVGRS